MDSLGDEVLPAGHGPRDGGLLAPRFEGELGNVAGPEGLLKVELDPNQIAGPALRHRHAAFQPGYCRTKRTSPPRPKVRPRSCASCPDRAPPRATTPPSCGNRSPARRRPRARPKWWLSA